MSGLFADVAHLRVTEEQPATSTSAGLDFERCSALHNAITRYGWLSSGHDLLDLPEHTWWTRFNIDDEFAEAESRLDDSVMAFLKRALSPGKFPNETGGHAENSFFYTLGGLALPSQLWQLTGDFNEDHIALYLTHDGLSDSLEGIVYDLSTHLCIFNGRETYDLYDGSTSLAWQPLETILSVYIDMIERGKAVALHKTIVPPDREFFLNPEDGRILPAELHPNPPPRADLATGAIRGLNSYAQWTLVRYAKQDLEDSLSVWSDLLDAIDERRPHTPQPPVYGIFTETELQGTRLRVNGFAWNFFLRARKPDFAHIGPGLRLTTLEELSRTLFPHNAVNVSDSPPDLISPVPILTGSQTAASWLVYPFAQETQVPCGLYFDACELEGPCPFEDGCRLVLPFPLGENGFARTADDAPLSNRVNDGHAELYQIGFNPFIPDHSSQLLAVLAQFCGAVRQGAWSVGADGVEGGVDVFLQADTDGPLYGLVLGAGDRYW